MVNVLAELFDTRLRNVMCDASRKTHFVIPTSMKRWRLAKQHSVNVDEPCMDEWTVGNSENAYRFMAVDDLMDVYSVVENFYS